MIFTLARGRTSPARTRTTGSAWARDPYVWALGVLGYLLVALVLSIGASQQQRHAETALDLSLRRTGAEMALFLAEQPVLTGLTAEQRTRLSQLWGAMTGQTGSTRPLFAAVHNARRDILWAAGTDTREADPRNLATSRFPVPNTGLTVDIGYRESPRMGGFAGILLLFVLFAIIPGIGAYLLMRPGAEDEEEVCEAEPCDADVQDMDERSGTSSDATPRPMGDLLSLARCGIGKWESDGDMVTVSRSLLELVGLDDTRDEEADFDALITRRAFLDLMSGDSARLFDRIEARARTEGGLKLSEPCTLRHADGSPVAMQVTVLAAPRETESGADAMQFFAIWTERADAEQADTAAATEDVASMIAVLLEGLPEGVALWSEEGPLIAANALFARRLGVSARVLSEDTQLGDIEALGEIFDHDGLWLRRRIIDLGEGEVLVMLSDVTGEVQRGAQVKALKARVEEHERDLAAVEDVLARKDETIAAVERSLSKETARADAAQHALAEFLANASHELRTPLNAILGFTEMIQQEIFGPLGNDKYREYVADIHESGRSLLDLIQDLLDMSRLCSGRVEMDPKRIEIGDLLRETARLARPLAEEKEIDLSVGDALVPAAYADAQAAKRILLHLLSNAIKFTPEGGSVKLSAHADLRLVSIIVEDTGVGIEAEDLERLGQPFARSRRAEESGEPGMGLGLAMSRSLAELNGGSLDIESTMGRGTRVTVRLPRRPVNTARKPNVEGKVTMDKLRAAS